MKILHISPVAERGGCEFNALTMVKEIPGQHRVLLLNNGQGPMVKIWQEAGAVVDSFGLLGRSFFHWPKALKKAVNQKSYDIIIYWSHMHLPVVLSALAPYCQKILVHIGNPIFLGPKQKLLRRFQNLVYPFDHKKVALRPVSEYVNQSYQGVYPYNQLQSKVSFKPIDVAPITRASPSEQRVVFGMMARMDSIKDFKTLIQAFAELLKTKPECTLVLAGDGPDKPALENLAESLGFGEKIQFVGQVADKNHFYASLDVFVYSTTKHEGLAGVVGEALVAGLPCICSDWPMLREWERVPKSIRFVPPQNAEALTQAMQRAINEQEANAKSAQANASAYAEHFSPRQFALNYLDD